MMKIKKIMLLVCLVVLFGCEKKVTTEDATDNASVVTDESTLNIDESSPIKFNEATIDIESKSYDPEKIYNNYFSNGGDLNVVKSIEDVGVTKDFLLLHKQFESEWKYWLYDNEELGQILLKEKNLDTQEERLKESIENLKVGVKRWKYLLKKVEKVCQKQASSVDCT